MTDTDNVHEALTAVMRDVQKIGKDRRVTEGPAKFNFRGVDDVVNVVGPVLREHGVIIVPEEVMSLEQERYVTKTGSHMHASVITIRWRIYGPGGDSIPAMSAGQAADSGDKSVSKAHSVAYRTVMLQALCIPTDEVDPDTNVHERAAETPPDPKVLARAKIKGIGDQRKMTVQEIGDDFAAWSKGSIITEADLEVLQQYQAYLEALPPQVQS